MIHLPPTVDHSRLHAVLLNAFEDAADAVRAVQSARIVDQSPADRERARTQAIQFAGCFDARIRAALDLIPVAEACCAD